MLNLGHRPSCLFVGDAVSLWRAESHLPTDLRIKRCQIYDLVPQIRLGPAPDIILSFAITPLFDCLDLAQLLKMNSFTGRQRIVDQNLPAPSMICREVKAACPGLDFDVLDVRELRYS